MLENCYQFIDYYRFNQICFIFTLLKKLTVKKKDIKILLVDDEPDILEIVGYNLENEGYQVFTGENGAEAIEKAMAKTK